MHKEGIKDKECILFGSLFDWINVFVEFSHSLYSHENGVGVILGVWDMCPTGLTR